MIRLCTPADFDNICDVVNDGARAYRGVIPDDCWHEPYMGRDELRREIDDGVVFWGFGMNDGLVGVMGMQNSNDVTLIRHAYVRSGQQRQGIGTILLSLIMSKCRTPMLVGTWAAASWAIAFYSKHGFRLTNRAEGGKLLTCYWRISARQVETSVVLADRAWFEREKRGERA